MVESNDLNQRFNFLKEAFARDNFNIKDFSKDEKFKNLEYVTQQGYMLYQGKIGILAEHKTAINIVSREPKRVFYVEGSNQQMGFLMGLMAEPGISVMTTEFIEDMVFQFYIKPSPNYPPDHSIFDPIKKLLSSIIQKGSEKMVDNDEIPVEYIEELKGMLAGCQAVCTSQGKETAVTLDALYALNFGFDWLLAHVYEGLSFQEHGIPPFLLNLPVMCSGFSISDPGITGDRHYFGRDFQFSTSGIYQYTGCLIIYCPDEREGKPRLPVVGQTATGIIGFPAAMNMEGLAIGVDMTPTKLVDSKYPGLNSLLLNRDCMHYCSSIGYTKGDTGNTCTDDETGPYEDIITRMMNTKRGVSWLYPVADGKSGTACVIEAGRYNDTDPFPYFDYVSEHFKDPTTREMMEELIRQSQAANSSSRTPEASNGVIARQGNYLSVENDLFLNLNRRLWELYNDDFFTKLNDFIQNIIEDAKKLHNKEFIALINDIFNQLKYTGKTFDPAYFEKMGFIDRTIDDRNCPGPFYFAPQRENRDDILIVTNAPLDPGMRLTAMNEWTTLVYGEFVDDLQWRYDILNNNISRAVERAQDPVNPQLIDEKIAQDLIDFLRPDGDFPGYYNPDNARNWKTIPVQGSICLFELKKEKYIKSHFGYFADEWIKITLPNYIKK